MDKIAAIVLASGKAMRFKSNKLLYEVNSKPIIYYAIDNVARSNFQQRIIVLRSPEISDYSERFGYKVVWNKDYENGMSSSIIHGIENVSPDIEAAMIIPGDMPLLDSNTFNGLIEHFKSSGKGISGFEYNGTIISPVIFARKYFSELKELSGDKGAKSIIVKHYGDFSHMIISGDLLIDIDTMDDALKFKNLIKHKN
ncbi:nucleotidyltransferase family protein [Ferroplasma acidiphilum]|jgi:molybdenum cofactor cytidylyltransferase|uniref:Nucleotidyltransferase family protein n=1 Tax=Ferroplasma acidiphilum TaxID=74969 RepID=A0A7K4FQW6_9ARCH|nr:nucleotidyltransferase family protein [Ferroplasma acidiphilum]NOL60708.1 nucleotidyltransferase family protein [Ferroplasma acidiphilum]WMT53618.1 MAG: nucleotidyltransferase family protein [Ferroplasma acidiphilum]